MLRLADAFVRSCKCGLLALASVMFSHHEGLAQAVRIFDVDVYVIGTPECRLMDISPDLRATVSPFQENIPLGDVIAELARRAAQAGATILHSIRLISVKPYEGAQVTGKAATCSDKGLGPFESSLVSALYEAKSARSFLFPQSGSLGFLRSVEKSEKIAGREFTGEDLDRIRTLISWSARNDTPGLRKSCPFDPSIGFQFVADTNEVWWLVSSACETAMLISKDQDWRRSPLINLRPDVLTDFQQIAGVDRSPGSQK